MVSIILTVHNKEKLLDSVITAILTNRVLPGEVLVVLDGCTDNSEQVCKKYQELKLLYTDDIWEVKANNVGLKESQGEYCLLIQDDMVVNELGFDERLLKPFINFKDVLAVSSITAHDDYVKDNHLIFTNVFKNLEHRNLFGIRDVCVRGPLMLDHLKLEALNYLDEYFYPLTFDDHDLCIRGKREFGWVSGCFPTKVISLPEWGTTRSGENASKWERFYKANEQKIIERHSNYLLKPREIQERTII